MITWDTGGAGREQRSGVDSMVIPVSAKRFALQGKRTSWRRPGEWSEYAEVQTIT